MRPLRIACLAALLCGIACATARAQFGEVDDKGPQRGQEFVNKYEVGMIITAGSEPCTDLIGTAPVPIDWPEQEVRVMQEDFDPAAKRVQYREAGGGTIKQMVVNIPLLPANEKARVVVVLEISRFTILPPKNTDEFVIPKKLARGVRQYLAQSPKIETTNPKIRALAKEITADQEGAWEKVEAIYDWVREHVKYVNGPLRGALAALNDGKGDCEELTSLFIALCRDIGVPARTVWVPGHCYPEFYLEDGEGKGHWFPCQAAGARSFGGIDEKRPILQKGDNFTVPERREKLRYVSEFLRGDGGQPRVQWVRGSSGA
ncbi:MAG TPA: transglutaminase-like domain-containing protein [Pirellulales bacterium]|nr:transglutaminase-like domain-containing protein [Pirellulales bacterium]